MTKNDFLMQLNKNLKVLDASTRDDVLEYYEEIIDEEINEGKTLSEIFNKLGHPEELARKIVSNMRNGETFSGDLDEIVIEEPDYKEPIRKQTKSYEPQNHSKFSGDGVTHTRVKEKNSHSLFWTLYFSCGIITIPLTIAFGAVALVLLIAGGVVTLALSVSTYLIAIAGVATMVMGVTLGVMGESIMIAFASCGAGILVFVIGLYLSYLAIKLFKMLILKRKKGAN